MLNNHGLLSKRALEVYKETAPRIDWNFEAEGQEGTANQ